MEPILSLQNISYSYHTLEGETKALSNITMDCPHGSFTAIVGASGCGKSTLLSIIAGLIKPDTGKILFNGKNSEENQLHIGYMLQKDNLFEWRSVYSNCLLGLETRKELTKEKKDNVDKMLGEYGLYQFRNARPSQLSGGMRQRAALIRTLALEPDILLLDEPFSALDYQTRLKVSDDIYKIIKEQKKTAILVTHDISEAVAMGERIIVLSARPGRIKNIINVHFPDDETIRSPFATRSSPEFSEYFNTVWEELQYE